MTVMDAWTNGTPATLTGSRVVMVADPRRSKPLAIRWRSPRAIEGPGAVRWHCAVHGDMTDAGCAHTFAAALHLAEDLLGLRRAQDLPGVLPPTPGKTTTP